MTEKILLNFVETWADQNTEKLVSFFTDDCIYKTSVGPEPGSTYRGKESVMNGISVMMKNDSRGVATVHNIKIHKEFGMYEWTYTFPDKTLIFGCDLFEFKGNKIKMINAFRKTTI